MSSLNILRTQRVTPKTRRIYAVLHMLNKVTQPVCQNLFFWQRYCRSKLMTFVQIWLGQPIFGHKDLSSRKAIASVRHCESFHVAFKVASSSSSLLSSLVSCCSSSSLLLSLLATCAKNEVNFLVPTTAFLCFLVTLVLWAFRVPHIMGRPLALRLDSQLFQPSLRLLCFVLARLFHVLKLKLFLLPNNILAKRVNVNINGRLAVKHSHLLLLASRLILVVTCLPSLSQSLELLLLFVKSPHGGHYCLRIGCGWRRSTVVWACACLCTGPPEGAKATPLHNPNPTSPNPNSKNSSNLCWYFWPKFGRQTFLQVAFRCHALYKDMRTRLIYFLISFWAGDNQPLYQDLYFFHTQLVPKCNNSHKCNNNFFSHAILLTQISNFHLLKRK